MMRKCPNCKKWNEGNDYCKYCQTPISPRLIRDLEDEADRESLKVRNRTTLDKLQEKIDNSTNPFVKFFNKILSVLWIIYMGIISFIIWFVTLIAG